VCDGCALQLGAEAADDILAGVFRVPVAKELNPLNHLSFVAIIRRVARALRAEAGPIEELVAEHAQELVDIDWTALSATQREAKQAALQKVLQKELGQARERALPGIKAVLETHADKIVPATRKRLVAKYDLGIQATMTERDTRTSATLVDQSCLFVRNQYGEVATRLSARARDIVAAGVEAGLGRDDIAGDLVKAMAGARRPDSYWNLIATVFANRARNFTQVHALDEAGIKAFAIEAILDEVTSEICRFLHGKQFPVAQTVKRIQQVQDAKDPEDILDLMPWARKGKNADGQDVLFYEKGETKRTICVVEESGEGEKDKVGRYSEGMAEETLARAGMSMPPFHGNCRTTVVPVF
jgi:hypothetical protein